MGLGESAFMRVISCPGDRQDLLGFFKSSAGSLGDGVTGGCEPSGVGAGN
uniref:Uncharacterized protein n=1 Tax=Trichinella nativa TaxID=6335 RepID=A0A0V1J5P5_9BILA